MIPSRAWASAFAVLVGLALPAGGDAQTARRCPGLVPVRRAVERWCRDPRATMEPYPYGWSARRTKRVACRDLDRAIARCRLVPERSDDGRDMSIELPVRFAEATVWLLHLERVGARWRVVHASIEEDCTGP